MQLLLQVNCAGKLKLDAEGVKTGQLIFSYDGDAVSETGIDGITNPSVGVLVGSIALIGAGIASFIVLKKHSRKECAA